MTPRPAPPSPGTAWADLLRALAPDPPPPAWRRGSALAASGAVTGLKVLPGEATAHIRDHHGPTTTSLLWPPARQQDWQRAAEALAAQPVFRDALLAGLLPVETARVCELLGWPALPRRFDDIACVCSCPAWQDPCPHAAALLLALADQVERDPFTVAAWRGCTREDLLERVGRAARTHHPAPQAPADDPAAFWAAPALPDTPPLPAAPAHSWAPPPAAAGQDLAAALAPLYTRLAGPPPDPDHPDHAPPAD
ncbi:SWIM zinc finger family protein [Streptomonospora nanhaiensis]|uniref:SWIM zinc finger family protein n=1 Tax=Streptomonospora nanhaiensis TaxID=1323731 RepID=UPI001C99BC58|nr:SWIM zinc finger family protein [Streptomonospora nanhaiensis]MBX9389275.1 SWIM zinc finger family protein [Streptomonospora nanhaiensis]